MIVVIALEFERLKSLNINSVQPAVRVLTIGVRKVGIASKIPSRGRGAVDCEMAGRGLATNAHETTYAFNFGKKLQPGGKIVR